MARTSHDTITETTDALDAIAAQFGLAKRNVWYDMTIVARMALQSMTDRVVVHAALFAGRLPTCGTMAYTVRAQEKLAAWHDAILDLAAQNRVAHQLEKGG